MYKIFDRIRALRNNKGIQLIEMLIILAIVATIAIAVIPKMNGRANSTLDKSMDKVDTIDTNKSQN